MLHILLKVYDLNDVYSLHNVNTHRPAMRSDTMKKKDEWMTPERVAEDCEKLLAEGKPIHAINANMVIERLGTKGRRTVYKYVELWRAAKLTGAPLPPFVLDEETGRRLVAVFTGLLGEIVRDDRQAAADLVASADQRAAAAEADRLGLLTSLGATEQEREDAVEKLRLANVMIEEVRTRSVRHEALAATYRRERDELLERYMQPAPASPAKVGGDEPTFL